MMEVIRFLGWSLVLCGLIVALVWGIPLLLRVERVKLGKTVFDVLSEKLDSDNEGRFSYTLAMLEKLTIEEGLTWRESSGVGFRRFDTEWHGLHYVLCVQPRCMLLVLGKKYRLLDGWSTSLDRVGVLHRCIDEKAQPYTWRVSDLIRGK